MLRHAGKKETKAPAAAAAAAGKTKKKGPNPRASMSTKGGLFVPKVAVIDPAANPVAAAVHAFIKQGKHPRRGLAGAPHAVIHEAD